MHGYINMKRGVNATGICGIAMQASYPIVTPSAPTPVPPPTTGPQPGVNNYCGCHGPGQCAAFGQHCCCMDSKQDISCQQEPVTSPAGCCAPCKKEPMDAFALRLTILKEEPAIPVTASPMAKAKVCSSPSDCSLNGVCTPSGDACQCDPAWEGDQCNRLRFAGPAARKGGFHNTSVGAGASWGGLPLLENGGWW